MSCPIEPYHRVRLHRTNPPEAAGQRLRVSFRLQNGRLLGLVLSAEDARQMAESILFALSQHDKPLSSQLKERA